MRRYAAEVSYDGAGFSGWQSQPGLTTVQGVLEEALSLLDGSRVAAAGAGRTDAGVHAKGQVCSFDLNKAWDIKRLLPAVNANLPKGVSVVRLAEAPSADFHARFDAVSREYIYFVWNSNAIYPALTPNVCWLKQGGCDWAAAAEACAYLEGEHDFGAFCRAGDRPENCRRTIYRAKLRKKGNLIYLRLTGSGFLTNMVRIIMGSLALVARGEREPLWVKSLLTEARERSESGRTFPPNGLFLWGINYQPSPWNPH